MTNINISILKDFWYRRGTHFLLFFSVIILEDRCKGKREYVISNYIKISQIKKKYFKTLIEIKESDVLN